MRLAIARSSWLTLLPNHTQTVQEPPLPLGTTSMASDRETPNARGLEGWASSKERGKRV